MSLDDKYTVGQWRDMDNYECRECAFSTLDRLEMIQHVSKVHVPKPEMEPVNAPILDRFGNRVKEREV